MWNLQGHQSNNFRQIKLRRGLGAEGCLHRAVKVAALIADARSCPIQQLLTVPQSHQALSEPQESPSDKPREQEFILTPVDLIQ